MTHSLVRKYVGIFAVLFIPPIILLSSISIWMFINEVDSKRMLVKQSEMLNLYQSETVFEHLLESAIKDLMFLASVEDLQQLVIQPEINRSAERVALIFKSMVEEKQQFDQIRYLNEEGKEVIRVNNRYGEGEIVPSEKLQNKGGRYYFKNTMMKVREEIFVSPMDLNIEHGNIE